MSEEHKQRTREMIKVMQAYVDGQQVEVNHPALPQWRQANAPGWDFTKCEYRIANKTISLESRRTCVRSDGEGSIGGWQ